MSIREEDHRTQSIRGNCFDQQSLNRSLQNTVAGQKRFFKGILLLLILGLCFVGSWLASWIGGGIAINICFGHRNLQAYAAMLVINIVVIGTAVFQNHKRVVLTLIVSFLLTAIIPELLNSIGILRLQSFHSLRTLVLVVFGLGCSSISFIGVRFAIAMADILWANAQFIKLISLLSSVAATYFGSMSAIAGEVNSNTSEFRDILRNPTDAQVLIIVSSMFYGLSLFSSSWLANTIKGVPWSYPNWIRAWVLVFGSWWGTSFANLDLSSINFRNAKLSNSDLRARKLYRTCFQGSIGLERARVDNQYLDLEYPKVQRLLTHGSSRDQDFRGFNLQGAYLQNADMRGFDLTDTNLTGADFKGADLRDSILIRTQLANTDFQGVDLRKNVLIDANLTEADLRRADLRGSILVRAQVARANFTGADLTGICIEDWSVSSKTRFTDVRCDYIFRKYQDGQPSDRYPVDRDFEPGEFASLFAEPEDVVELVFKGEFNIAALSLALYNLQTNSPELNLELRGIEQREKLWVAKIRSTSSVLNERLIEERLTSVYDDPSTGNITVETTIKNSIYRDYEEIKHRLAESEQLNRQLAEVTGSQAEALKELSKRSFGNNFFISGSTITNLAGSGQIDYREAASSIRSLVTNRVDPHATLQQLIGQLNAQNVATTSATQRELIQQVLLSEANQDPTFRQFLLEQGQQIISSLPSEDIAIAVQAAIVQLKTSV